MHKHILFVGFVSAFFCGVTLAVFVTSLAWVVIGFFFVGMLFVALVVPRFGVSALFSVIVAGSILGVWRGGIAQQWAYTERMYDGAQISFDGVALGDPVEGAFSQRMIVGVRSCVMDGVQTCPIKKVLLRTDMYGQKLFMRSGVRASCNLKQIENFTPEFDYVMYLAAKGVLYECVSDNVVAWESVEYRDRFYAILAQIRMQLETLLVHHVPQPQAALAAGLLFGGDERLSQVWQDRFSVTGLTHIVAVSGYNVTIIAHALILFGIFVGLWRRQSVWLAVGGVVLFVLMIGAPSPAIRAGVMGVTVLLLMYGGRMGAAIPALFFAGAVMVAFNPLLVRYDIGFQLSFLATLGIIILYPIMERLSSGRGRAFGLVDIIFVTTSAQVFVVPVIAYHFHTFATLSLIANILVLPMIPVAMALTCSMLVFGIFSSVFAMWGGWLIAVLLAWVFVVVKFFAQLPYAQIEMETVSLSLVILWYACVSAIILFAGRGVMHQCKHKEK